jgi:glucose/galactose transporter
MEKLHTGKNNYLAILIIGVLFFIFGFISWLNSLLIPYFKLACGLNTRQSMLVAFAFYVSYFVMAIPSSKVLKRTGFKNGMTLGLWVMAVGALLFVPAALSRSYSAFLFGLFVQATGLTILQTASNPYITILGPIESAARRISIMGVCNKTAGALAPLILLSAVTKSPGEIDQLKRVLPGLSLARQTTILNELASRLILPYVVMALVMVVLGLLIRYSPLPDIKEEGEASGKTEGKKSILQFPHLLLGTLAIFFGVSVEVLAVDSIIGYSEYMGYSFKDAKYFATYTLLIMIISYLAGMMTIPRYIRQKKVLQWSAILGLITSLLAITVAGKMSVWFIALLGLSNALLWPSTWPLALEGLGRFTKQGSALLIMGVVGGAVTPLAYGVLSDRYNPQQAYWILVPCYMFILYFGVKGYGAGKRIKQR